MDKLILSASTAQYPAQQEFLKPFEHAFYGAE